MCEVVKTYISEFNFAFDGIRASVNVLVEIGFAVHQFQDAARA